jgi:hypothetical protein
MTPPAPASRLPFREQHRRAEARPEPEHRGSKTIVAVAVAVFVLLVGMVAWNRFVRRDPVALPPLIADRPRIELTDDLRRHVEGSARSSLSEPEAGLYGSPPETAMLVVAFESPDEASTLAYFDALVVRMAAAITPSEILELREREERTDGGVRLACTPAIRLLPGGGAGVACSWSDEGTGGVVAIFEERSLDEAFDLAAAAHDATVSG